MGLLIFCFFFLLFILKIRKYDYQNSQSVGGVCIWNVFWVKSVDNNFFGFSKPNFNEILSLSCSLDSQFLFIFLRSFPIREGMSLHFIKVCHCIWFYLENTSMLCFFFSYDVSNFFLVARCPHYITIVLFSFQWINTWNNWRSEFTIRWAPAIFTT